MLSLAFIKVIPVCIAVCSNVLGTVDLIPAVASPAFLYDIVVVHILDRCASCCSDTIKLCVGRCSGYLCWCVVDPLVKHLAMLVEHVVTAIYFLLSCILVHLAVGSEPVPALIITVVIVCAFKDLLLVVILISIAWLLQP